jgi:hypothetical protein
MKPSIFFGTYIMFLACSATCFAESTSAAMESFGLLGTWSPDCSKELTQPCEIDNSTSVPVCAKRVTYTAPFFGTPQATIVIATARAGETRTIIRKILDARRVSEMKLQYTYLIEGVSSSVPAQLRDAVPEDGEIFELTFEKQGNKLKTWSFQRQDGKKQIIKDGIDLQGRNPHPAETLEKCTD